jgi:hypothetical protein
VGRRGGRNWFTLAGAVGLAVLGACSSNAIEHLPVVEPGRTDVLAPFEEAEWPAYLGQLDLARGRDYVTVAFLPTKYPFDLRDPQAARTSLLRGLTDPTAELENDTKIGHTIVGWQCGAHQGMASMTGGKGNVELAMLAQGWAMAPFFSTFTDGSLYPEGGHKRVHMDGLKAGGGVVTAIEVGRAECENLRTALTRFLTHPNQPQTRFGMLVDPARFEGGGCISFAAYLLNAAGVMREVTPHFRREVPIHAGMIGVPSVRPPGVEPYVPPDPSCCAGPRSVLAAISADWGATPVVERVSALDTELVFSGLVAMRRGVAPDDDWRFSRMLAPDGDAPLLAVMAAARRFAARYPVRRIADPGGTNALVLERR